MKTYSELITDALIQCDETAGSGASTARTIVKAGINESYAEIASIRDWDTLSNSASVSATVGVAEYTPVTASASVCRIRRIESVVDETSDRMLAEIRREIFLRDYPYVDPSLATNQGAPVLWYQSGYDSDRNIQVSFWQVPETSRTMRVRFIEEPLPLTNDTDVPRIPDQYHFGLAYLGIAKYYEYQKDPIASYYRQLHEQFKMKILDNEWGDTDEMPTIAPQSPTQAVIVGKLGRVYNR